MNLLKSVGRDLGYAVRSFRKDLGSILLALLALSLGIGAATVMFSVVYSVLIDPFPYKDASRLVYIYVHNMKDSGPYGRFSYTVNEFRALKDQNHVFDDLMPATRRQVVYTVGNAAYDVRGGFLDPATFEGLGVKPELGREITDSDGAPGAPPVFAITDRLWHERFNGNPSVIGKTFRIDGTMRTLIAVMPPRFLLFRADIFIPVKVTSGVTDPDLTRPVNGSLYFWTAGRLKPGVSLAEAAADCNVILHNEAKIYPNLYPKNFKVNVGTIIDLTTVGLRTTIYILLGAVMLLLLIACANVANLLLARATAREKELAIRASIGATRGRLVRQMLTESFVLAAAGAIIGCLLAYVGLQYVKVMIPPNTIPEEVVLALSFPALLATVGITLLTTLLCGLPPALRASRRELAGQLMGSARGIGVGAGHGKLRSILVAVQVSLSIVLLIGAGLLMRTFFALSHVDLGFNPKNVLVAPVVFPPGTSNTPPQEQAFFQKVLAQVGAMPGVRAAAESLTPPGEELLSSPVAVPGRAHAQTWISTVEFVSQGYFQAIGLPLLRGDLLSAQEVDSARRVAVINSKFAQEFFGTEDPTGRTIQVNLLNRLTDAPHNAFFRVVGIVGNARNRAIETEPAPEVFLPASITAFGDSTGFGNRTLLVRTAVTPLSVLRNVRQIVAGADSNVSVSNAGTLEASLQADYMASPEFGLVLLGIFAAIGLILSVIGVFSVIAYSVSLETHDIGIRMVLGADSTNIVSMVLAKGLRPITVGVAVGLIASYGLTRVLANQLFGVKATDPLTFAGVAIILVAVGAAACYFPARRAAKVDPLPATRHE